MVMRQILVSFLLSYEDIAAFCEAGIRRQRTKH